MIRNPVESSVNLEIERRLKIGIDVDEVLADLITPLIKYFNSLNNRSLKKEDLHSYNLWEVWGGTRDEAVSLVFNFYETEAFTEIKPIPGAPEAIAQLSKTNELIAITSRPKHVELKTKDWLSRYFPSLFLEIYHTGDWSKDGERIPKSVICQRLGIDVMIEDSKDYAAECSSRGIPVLLLDSPWNKGDLPKGVLRMKTWKEIVGHVSRISPNDDILQT